MSATLRLEKHHRGLYFLLVDVNDGSRSVIIQTDWDYPGVASNFGFVACECGETDGTVDCPHHTARDMISRAYTYLCEHEGKTIEDPGYLDS